MRYLFITLVVSVASYMFGYYAYPAVNVSGIQGGSIGPEVRDTVRDTIMVDSFRIKYGRYKNIEYKYWHKGYAEQDHCKRSYYDDTASLYRDSAVAILLSARSLD